MGKLALIDIPEYRSKSTTDKTKSNRPFIKYFYLTLNIFV